MSGKTKRNAFDKLATTLKHFIADSIIISSMSPVLPILVSVCFAMPVECSVNGAVFKGGLWVRFMAPQLLSQSTCGV